MTTCEAAQDVKPVSPLIDPAASLDAQSRDPATPELFTCTSCNVTCTGLAPFQEHLTGTTHRRTISGEGGNLKCTICNVITNSRTSYEAHVNGFKHKRKADSLAQLPRENPSISQPKTCGDEVNNSPPAVNNLFPAVNDSSPAANDQYKCISCDLTCLSYDQLVAHLRGKKHAKNCKRKASSVVDSVTQNLAEITGASQPSRQKRIVISFKESQFKKNLDLLSQLEASLCKDQLSDSFLSLPLCLQQPGSTSEDDGEPESKRPAIEAQEVSKIIHFCRHTRCVVARALTFYQSELQKMLSGNSVTTKAEPANGEES